MAGEAEIDAISMVDAQAQMSRLISSTAAAATVATT